MPTPLEYERFRLSQDRFGQQGNQFDETMDFRRMQDERNFGYRTERDDTMMDWRRQQAAQQERLALLRMLPKQQRARMVIGGRMSAPEQAALDYDEALERQNAHNMAAVPSWQAERDRSNFATETGMDLRNYAAQQQMSQMARIQQRQAVVDGPMNALARQAEADQLAADEKTGFMRADQIGKFYGAKPGDLYNNYDPKTGISTLPGDYLQGDEPGKFVQKPGRQVKLDAGHYAALQGAFPRDAGKAMGPAMQQIGDVANNVSSGIGQSIMQGRLNQATGLGARPEVVGRAMETLAQMGGGTEEELQQLIAQLSDIDIRQQASMRRTSSMRQGASAVAGGLNQQHRDAARQASQEWESLPWWQKMSHPRGQTPMYIP